MKLRFILLLIALILINTGEVFAGSGDSDFSKTSQENETSEILPVNLLQVINFNPSILNKLGLNMLTPAIVAISDTGVEYTHDELKDLMLPGMDFVDLAKEPDGVVSIAYMPSYLRDLNEDYIGEDSDPMDRNGHGTHVAGIIAQVSDRKVKILPLRSGYNIRVSYWDSRSVKFLEDNTGALTTFSLVKSIIYAVDQGAKVINASWGGAPTQALLDAFLYAQRHGALIVAAAGNQDYNSPSFPSAFGLDNIISVAALGEENEKAFFSNFGSYISVAAPGQDIESTYLGNSRKIMSGTSMSAPVVSGFAGLIFSAFPGLEYREVRAIIEKSVDQINSQNGRFDEAMGSGAINVNRGLKNAGNYIAVKDFFQLLDRGNFSEQDIALFINNLTIPENLERILQESIEGLDTNDAEKFRYSLLKALWDADSRSDFIAAVPMLLENNLTAESVIQNMLADGLFDNSETALLLETSPGYLAEAMSEMSIEGQLAVVKNLESVRQFFELSDVLVKEFPGVWRNIADNKGNFEEAKSAIIAEYNRIFVDGEEFNSPDSYLTGISPVVQKAFEYLAEFRDVDLGIFSQNIKHVNISGRVTDKDGNPLKDVIIKVSPLHVDEVDVTKLGFSGFIDELENMISHNYEIYRGISAEDGSFDISGIPLQSDEVSLKLDLYVLTEEGYIQETVLVDNFTDIGSSEGEAKGLNISLDLAGLVAITPKDYVRKKIENFVGRPLDENQPQDSELMNEYLDEFIAVQRADIIYTPLGNDYKLVLENGTQEIDQVFSRMEILRPLIEDLWGYGFDLTSPSHRNFMNVFLRELKSYDFTEVSTDFEILKKLKPAFDEFYNVPLSEVPHWASQEVNRFATWGYWLSQVESLVKYENAELDEAVETIAGYMKIIKPYKDKLPSDIDKIEYAVMYIDSIKEAEEFCGRKINLDNEEDSALARRFFEFNRLLSYGDKDYRSINAGNFVELQDAFRATGVELLNLGDIDVEYSYYAIPEFEEHYLKRSIDYRNADDLSMLYYWKEINYWIKDPQQTVEAIKRIPLFEKLYGRSFDLRRDSLDLMEFSSNFTRAERLFGEGFDLVNAQHFDFLRCFMLVVCSGVGPAILDTADDVAVLKIVDFVPYVEKLLGREMKSSFGDIAGIVSMMENLGKFENYLSRKLDLNKEEDFSLWRDFVTLGNAGGTFERWVKLLELRPAAENIEQRSLDIAGSGEDLNLLSMYYRTWDVAAAFVQEYFKRSFDETSEPDISIWRDWTHLTLETDMEQEDIEIEIYNNYVKQNSAFDFVPAIGGVAVEPGVLPNFN